MSKPDDDGIVSYDPFKFYDIVAGIKRDWLEAARLREIQRWRDHPYAVVADCGHCFEDVGERV